MAQVRQEGALGTFAGVPHVCSGDALLGLFDESILGFS